MGSNLASHQKPIVDLQYANEGFKESLNALQKGATASASSALAFVKGIAPTIKAVLSDSNDSLDLEDISKLSKDQALFLATVDKIPYSELKEIRAFKPEGLNVTYLSFMSVLSNEVDYLADSINLTVDDYFNFLAQLVSVEGKERSLDTAESQYSKIDSRRSAAEKKIASCYKQNSYETNTVIGQVVDRNKDWKTILLELDRLISKLESIDRKALMSNVERASSAMDAMIASIKKEETVNFTPQVIRRLTNSTLVVAKEIEFFGATYFRVLTLKGSIENTINKVKEVYS